MWFIGGSKTRKRKVKDGRSVRHRCDSCNAVVVFHEHDVTDKIHAFFVELFETTQRRMVCSECGEDHDVEELLTAAGPALRPPPRAALHAPTKRAELSKKPDADVDEMLAALKLKIHKK